MFKKSLKRNLRQRGESDDEDKHSGAHKEIAVVNIASLKVQREKRHRNKPKSRTSENSSHTQKSVLSFADDEEDNADTFKTKKSSRSSRIARHIKKLNQDEKQKGEAQNGGYTAEDLEELRKLSAKTISLETNLFSEHIPFPTNESADSKYSGIDTASRIRPGDIPNSNHIHAARKQREMMRKYGADYIPVENKKFIPEDEDLDGSGSDDGPSIEMRGIIDDAERVLNQIGANGEGDLHRDEEFDLWEAEMIKKGISTQQSAMTTTETEFKASKKANFFQACDKKSNDSYEAYAKVSSRPTVVKTSLVPQEATKLMKTRLAERLSALSQVHSSCKQDLARATLDVKESEDSAGNLLDLTTLSTQYSYFQDTRAYIADLVDCLTEKSAEIETLETSRYRIWKKKADAINSRGQKDMEDESSDISSAISGAKAQTAPSNQKQARMREREARRSYRRAMRQRSGNLHFHFEGMSTDDEESTAEKAEQYMEFQNIANYKSRLFEDVMEEFYNVKLILSKFVEWMNKHPKSYKDAYIDLCVPKLLTPFVRLAMLEWNPLEANCPGIESMIWYQDLLFFGAEKNCSEYEAQCGSPEIKILSSLVEKVLLTKIIHLVKEVWDPLSKTQSSRLSTLLCKLAQTYPCMRSDNRRCGELLLAICTRIQQTVERDAFIPLYPTSVLTTVVMARGFFERRSWTCIKLFKNILTFSKTVSQTALIELAFTLLLNRYIMLSLQTSPVTAASVYKCQCIADAIPSDWLANVDGLSTHLEPFSRYLLHSAKHIHTQLESCNEEGKQRARYCIAQLGKILLFLGYNDMSQTVAELLA